MSYERLCVSVASVGVVMSADLFEPRWHVDLHTDALGPLLATLACFRNPRGGGATILATAAITTTAV